MKIVLGVVALLVAWFIISAFRGAKTVQRAVRQKARQDYMDAKRIALLWDVNRDDSDLTAAATATVQQHVRTKIRTDMLGATLGGMSPSEFEYLDEYRNLIAEDEKAWTCGQSTEIHAQEVMAFNRAMTAILERVYADA